MLHLKDKRPNTLGMSDNDDCLTGNPALVSVIAAQDAINICEVNPGIRPNHAKIAKGL